MFDVDGSYLEGGGQILRTTCALSAITKKPCHIFNIRKGREKPGLMPQHLLGIQALAQLCNGSLEGDFLDSEEIKFYPGETYRDRVSVNIQTAGSITLVLQTLILPSLFVPSPIRMTFNGGATDTFFSPTIDYFRYAFLKILEKMTEVRPRGPSKVGGWGEGCSLAIETNIIRRGYYPEGGAKVEVTVRQTKLKNLNLTERGSLKKIMIISGASEFLKSKKVAERQLMGVREVLGKLKLPVEEKVEYDPTQCPGSQICLIAEFENTIIGTDNLGKLGKRAEDVGKEAALELLKEEKTNACLDKHLADQILPYIALAKGKSQFTVSKITNHFKTNIWVIEKFLEGTFKIEGNLIKWLPKS